MERVLILVNSHDLSPAESQSFFNSLLRTNFNGVVGLIADWQLNQENLPFEVWNLPHSYSEYFRSSNRLFLYNEVLKQVGRGIDRVMVSGIRDVIFQTPIQDIYPRSAVDLFYEDQSDSSPTLGQCPYNRMWIRRAYGEDMVNRLRFYATICAEIMYGTLDGMRKIIREMCVEAEKLPNREGLEDQAILNVMSHTHKLPYAVPLHNDRSYVYTVGNVPELIVKKKQILNKYYDVPAVIHQYDRHLAVL